MHADLSISKVHVEVLVEIRHLTDQDIPRTEKTMAACTYMYSKFAIYFGCFLLFFDSSDTLIVISEEVCGVLYNKNVDIFKIIVMILSILNSIIRNYYSYE